MKTKIWANGHEIPLNPFVSDLIGKVAKGIVSSLKVEQKETKKIEFRLRKAEVVSLEVNDTPISLQLTTGFARTIVESTLTGMLTPLKETEDANDVLIRIEEGES